ncbi:MAG: hypothetical protein PHY15_01965 [Eubacteriales bacterium]|nr:hypothetical protein [Eubacteriales bacterium]
MRLEKIVEGEIDEDAPRLDLVTLKKIIEDSKTFDEIFKEKGSTTIEEKLETKESYIKSLKEKAKSDITIYTEKPNNKN